MPIFNQNRSISTKVFGEYIKSSDIVKGQFHNPYFLSYISALAEAPGRIEKLFEILFKEDTSKGSLGIYGVSLFKDGRKEQIVVDS